MTPKEYKEMMAHLTRPPRMKVAQLDNVNTPDLDQTPDSILRPGETLEDFDVTFRRPNANGGRISFNKGGLSVDLYNSLYDEYAKLIEQGIKNENLIDTPSWDRYVKSKKISPMALQYYAGGEGIRINPTTLLQNKKIELAEKIIEKENAKLDGAFKRGKNPPKGKLHVAELFRNKVVGPSWSLGGKHKGMNTLLNNLINTKLDTRADKIKKAFKLVTSPEYELSDGIRNEIAKLMGESKDMFDAGKLKGPYGPAANDVWEELSKPYEYVDKKTGKTKNLLKTINQKINKLPKGTDTTFSYLLELAENDKAGKAGFSDWQKFAGDKPEQWAMRQVDRAWKNNDPRLKVYDLNGKPITWEAGKKISSDKILFEYVDEKFPQYKNKLYSFYKPKKTTGLNYPVYDLSTQIRKLPEWKELVEVVNGKNKLKTTEMINPFTGKNSTYQKVYEDIYSRVGTTQATTKGGYSKVGTMGVQIDHDFGQAKGLFNNLRLSTGQQNLMFKTLADAAEKEKALKPYVRALETEMYTGGSIDDQIKAIVNETNELGKVVKNAPGKITIPTATQTASLKFLQNKIPDLPESVINYLEPKAEAAKKILQETPDLKKVYNIQNALADLAANIDPNGCGRKASASGGRIGLRFGSTACATKAKNYLNQVVDRGIQNEPPARVGLIKKIISGTGNFIKQSLSPSELFKLENLVGKPALYATAVIESGLLLDDVLRKKEPINVAAAENFLVGNLLNLDADAENAKNIINNPNLSPAAKTYAQGIIDQDNFRKLSQTYATNLVKNPLFIPSGAKAKADTALANLKNKIINTPETGRMDYESLLADKQDAFTAKEKPFDAPDKPGLPSFTSGQLEKRNVPGEFVIDPSFPLPLQKETLVPSYVSPSYSPERPKFETDEFINEYFKSIGEEPLRSGEGTLIRMGMPQSGLFGTKKRFAGGGIAKIAGVTSGPPPESGPNPQGLPSLLKRGRNR